MRWHLWVLMLVAVGTCAMTSRGADAAQPTTVGLIPFIDVSPAPTVHKGKKYYERAWSSLVVGGLQEVFDTAPGISLVDASRIEEVMRTAAGVASAGSGDESARQVGQLVAARYMVFGTVVKRAAPFNWLNDTYEVEVSARMVRVDSGTVVFNRLYQKRGSAPCDHCTEANAREFENQDAAAKLEKIVRHLAADLLERLPVEGEVVEVRGDGKVVVDIGSELGLRRGMTLTSGGKGSSVVDPTSGRTVEWPATESAQLLVLRVERSRCVVRCTRGSVGVGARVSMSRP
jgi:hypothetical protein